MSRIKELRKAKGYTQQQLADVLGIHLTNMNKLENGKSAPDTSRLKQIADALDTTMSELLADESSDEPRRLSEAEEYAEEQEHLRMMAAANGEQGYNAENFKPRIKGALPEIDVQLGAGEGMVGDMMTLDLGGESYSGHKIIGEWLFPEEFLRSEIQTSVSKTLVMPVRGDSMEPTYRPGDRVLVDLSQRTLTEDTVYVISDGESPPQIKRLQRVMFSKPVQVEIISDNPANSRQTVELAMLKILGRVVGVVSRR
jgi:phage repressor protein C with HTH and peptisase S24 domain